MHQHRRYLVAAAVAAAVVIGSLASAAVVLAGLDIGLGSSETRMLMAAPATASCTTGLTFDQTAPCNFVSWVLMGK